MSHAYGRLAKELLNRELPLQVCASKSDFYIGTHCPSDGPISRESQEVFTTRTAAQKALESGSWTQLTVECLMMEMDMVDS